MWPFGSCARETSCEAVDPNAVTTSTLLSLVPFVAVYAAAHVFSLRSIYPRLTSSSAHDGEEHTLPSHAPAALRAVHAEHGAKSFRARAAAYTFSCTVGLAACLGVLILAEVLDLLNLRARGIVGDVAVRGLLVLCICVAPWLECRSMVMAAGWTFQRSSKGRLPRLAYSLQLVLFCGWLFLFWSVGKAVPVSAPRTRGGRLAVKNNAEDSFIEVLTRAALERVGVVGISLMALLAGFASVSTPWHTFGAGAAARRRRPVTEADVNRKQAGLDATGEMLISKRYRLQALERRTADQGSSKSGFMGKMMGSIRGGASGEEMEMRSLRMEIAGLETMEVNLSSAVGALRSHRRDAERAATPMGRLLLAPVYVFSCYCVYRIAATFLTTVRRRTSPGASFSSSDPINRFLGLIARHWDPSLDQMAWARIISFGLSGVMLLLSANSVLQTLALFSRLSPPFLTRQLKASSLALASSQIAATYVISSSLLMRSQLPGEVSSAVGGALVKGAALMSPSFADGWFEGWFLVGAGFTGVGIWIGRAVGGGGGEVGGEWDEFAMEEMGAKRS